MIKDRKSEWLKEIASIFHQPNALQADQLFNNRLSDSFSKTTGNLVGTDTELETWRLE